MSEQQQQMLAKTTRNRLERKRIAIERERQVDLNTFIQEINKENIKYNILSNANMDIINNTIDKIDSYNNLQLYKIKIQGIPNITKILKNIYKARELLKHFNEKIMINTFSKIKNTKISETMTFSDLYCKIMEKEIELINKLLPEIKNNNYDNSQISKITNISLSIYQIFRFLNTESQALYKEKKLRIYEKNNNKIIKIINSELKNVKLELVGIHDLAKNKSINKRIIPQIVKNINMLIEKLKNIKKTFNDSVKNDDLKNVSNLNIIEIINNIDNNIKKMNDKIEKIMEYLKKIVVPTNTLSSLYMWSGIHEKVLIQNEYNRNTKNLYSNIMAKNNI